mmetsp:Transcript_12627/g.22502  ORF Transcript_12627/g.22502 Transcript_12627/m.22502 type:complete len:542 (-) Transcript_12627:39-1664(-)
MMEDQERGNTLEENLLPTNDRQQGEENQEGSEVDIPEFWSELGKLTSLSLPVALSTLARLVIINTDTAFVGHLPNGAQTLAAASFAGTWNSFLSNIVFAPGYALNSLGSQAIGAGNKKLAGVWLQLAIVMTSALCVPVLLGYLATKPIISLMVKGDDIPELAYQFNLVSILILWPMVMYMIIRQFFQALQIVKPAMVVSAFTVLFNYWMNSVFVPEDGPVGWGLKGSPFATFISMLFQLTSFLLYVVVYRGYHTPYWGGWSWECVEKTRVSRFLKMVIPMAVGIVLENSGLQLISFSTGHIGEANIAGHAILSSLWGVLWAFYWGYGLALQVRVGSYLGQGSAEGARLVAKISIIMVIIICFTVGLGSYIWRNEIAHLFTNDPDVIKVVENSMYALVIDYFLGCMALCAVNLLEAMAQNRVLAITLSVGMWLVQVPMSLIFAYWLPYYAKNRQVEGIWMGQVCGELFKLVLLWGYIARLDWEKMCLEAKERSEALEENGALEPLLSEEDNESIIDSIRHNMQPRTPSPFVGSRSPKLRHVA